MGAWRRDEGHQALDELASLHEDVGGAVEVSPKVVDSAVGVLPRLR